MTRIIDIPQTFLDTLISRVLNGPDDYQSKVNKYTQQIPSNPVGTIIFYTENIKPINSDEAIVCNANCDQIVGNASLLQPEFGTSTTVKGARKSSTITIRTTLPKVSAEECEEEFLYPGSKTAVNVKCGGSSTSAGKSNIKELTNEEISNSTTQGLLIGLFIVLIILGTGTIFFFLTKAAKLNFRDIFSRELWLNPGNIPWIIVTFIGFLAIASCFTAALFKINEESNKDTTEQKIKIKSWELFLIGFCIWFVCIIVLFLQSKYSFGKNSIGNSSYNSEIESFNRLRSRIISDYGSNPSTFSTPGSSGRANLLEASRIYNNLSPSQKTIINRNNPQLASMLSPNSKIIQDIKSPSTTVDSKVLGNLMQSLEKNPVLVTPKIRKGFDGLAEINPKLKEMDVKVGSPVPPGLKAYIDSKK